MIQLYNVAKLSKPKNKYTIQFFKIEPHLHSLFWHIPPIWNPPLKQKNTQLLLKNPTETFVPIV